VLSEAVLTDHTFDRPLVASVVRPRYDQDPIAAHTGLYKISPDRNEHIQALLRTQARHEYDNGPVAQNRPIVFRLPAVPRREILNVHTIGDYRYRALVTEFAQLLRLLN